MAGRKSAYRAAVLASATAVSVAWAGVQISSSSDATGGNNNNDASSAAVTQRMVAADWKVPNRSRQEAALRASTTVNPLDVLVIGMYATCVIIISCSLNFFYILGVVLLFLLLAFLWFREGMVVVW